MRSFETASGGVIVEPTPNHVQACRPYFSRIFFRQGLGTAAALLRVPLCLHVWSPALYGEWLALYSVVAYLSSFDLEVQTYAVNRLTQAYARGHLQEYRRCNKTSGEPHNRHALRPARSRQAAKPFAWVPRATRWALMSGNLTQEITQKLYVPQRENLLYNGVVF